jgi:thymidylate synthase (FAD)
MTMGRLITVLDKGYVQLVDHMGDDRRVSYGARIVDEDWRGEKDEKLIKYMAVNGHTSPFEHVVFTFEVKAPIFVLRQWHRHRTWSFNEESARYKESECDFYVPELDKIGVQSKVNHQARDLTVNDTDLFGSTVQLIDYQGICAAAVNRYKDLLSVGWPRELARCVLPLATYSTMVATVDLHNLLHFLRLRDHEHAQYEIREYAKALRELIKDIVPVTLEVSNGT